MTQEISDFLTLFSSILWEAIPFIVLGAAIAGVLEEFLPQQTMTRLVPQQAFFAVLVGAGLSFIFPMCECGIVVVMRRLLRKGLPLSCCVAYMLAGPTINVIVILSTWVAFGPHGIGGEMVAIRVGFGFIVSTSTALVVHLLYRKYGNALLNPLAIADGGSESDVQTGRSAKIGKKTVMDRLSNISGTALHDFVDITTFLIIGAVIAAFVKLQISNEQIESISRDQPLLAIPGMMILAVILCLCSEADAFVAASFTSMHISAKAAFLVLGPMLDMKLLLMFTRVFRLPLIATIAICTSFLVLCLCLGLHTFYEINGWTGISISRT